MEKSHESIMLQVMRVVTLFSFSEFIYNANISRASIKSGTWNIPEHSGTSRNIPEHPEHEKIKIFFYEKLIN